MVKAFLFHGQEKDKPKKDALHTALAVLTKSAAALLISRHLKIVPAFWRVVAVPYVGADNVDFDELLGHTKPFEVGVKVWISQMESNDWLVFYKAEHVLVYFLFSFSNDKAVIDGASKIFEDADRLFFEGEHLNDLLGYEWRKI